jgi:hypothetical protein
MICQQYAAVISSICHCSQFQLAVWNVMVWYTLEQRVFLYDTYVKYGSGRKCRRKLRRTFHDEIISSRQFIIW